MKVKQNKAKKDLVLLLIVPISHVHLQPRIQNQNLSQAFCKYQILLFLFLFSLQR